MAIKEKKREAENENEKKRRKNSLRPHQIDRCVCTLETSKKKMKQKSEHSNGIKFVERHIFFILN